MSWDVAVNRFSRAYRTVEELPQDEVPLSLGPREFVHERVLRVFPGTDWSDPAWGVWNGPDGSIEFNLGNEEPAMGLMLHVRAKADVVPAIIRLCRENGWQAMDCGSGDFLERRANPARGLLAWLAYRDRIMRRATHAVRRAFGARR
jgi:hypothetical protein